MEFPRPYHVLLVNKPNFKFDGESLITPELIETEALYAPSPSDQAASTQLLNDTLDQAVADFEANVDPRRIIHKVTGVLHTLRSSTSSDTWKDLLEIGRKHPAASWFMLDPFTKWSYEKPRGYSGDADLLDFYYFHPNAAERIASAPHIGRALYEYTSQAASSVAGRERREILTDYLDDIADKVGSEVEFLSIACGNLREAAMSEAMLEGKFKRWLALDQDPQSVASVAASYAGTAIEAKEGSVRTVLTKGHTFGTFDLVYATGLYDYLIDKVAIKLTKKCLPMLKPGAKFVFANFAEEIRVDGYMEMFMNWALLLRNDKDMMSIMEQSIEGEEGVFTCSAFYGANRNVVYGEITRIK